MRRAPMTAKNRILVIGATGRQGGAVARRLVEEGLPVDALTRDPSGAAALGLRRRGVRVLRGDLAEPFTLACALEGKRAVFAVTDFWEHGYDAELRQGRELVEAARRAGVEHFVFSSVGGTERTQGLGIRHFDAKREIEAEVARSGMTWTILRPVTFFENFVSARFKKAIRHGVLRFAIEPDKPFQMIAMRDLAHFASQAFAGSPFFRNRAVEIASDRCTMRELADALGRAVGRPVRYRRIPVPVQHLIGAVVRATGTSGYYKVGPPLIAQFRWNNASPTGGWDADLAALRAQHPGILSMESWVRSVDWSQP